MVKKVGIVVSKFNTDITKQLLNSCEKELQRGGIIQRRIKVVWVPGAYEIPFAVSLLAQSKKYSALIGLGCIIKGQTSHDKNIANWVSHGLGLISLQTQKPVLFGVLTPNNEKQARQRVSPGPLNRGKEVAQAALHMMDLVKKIGKN